MTKQISANEFHAVKCSDKKIAVIDVRSPMEYEAEHVDSSVNIPLSELGNKIGGLDRTTPIYLMCRSGKRAEMAAAQLKSAGIDGIVITGGIIAWRASGYPVQTGKKCLPLENQVQIIVGSIILGSSFLALKGAGAFLSLSALCGAGLLYTGLTGNCILAKVLDKAPWNQGPNPGSQSANNMNSAASASMGMEASSKKESEKPGCCG